MAKRRLIILGSTGSIGVQTLQVIESLPGEFEVVGLSSHTRLDVIAAQVRRFHPEAVCLVHNDQAAEAEQMARDAGVQLYLGEEGLIELIARHEADIVVVATVGFAGLLPTMEAIRRGRVIALANKEVLVAAGELVTAEARRSGSELVPIDSEHNAIFQCLRGESPETIRRIVLTASGGPFRRTPRAELENMTASEALRHPTWNMGPKITIDSATLMNKGFEVIECHHLFGVGLNQIEVVVHPQSVVHSFVEFHDGSVMAQLGRPDMRLPIQLALTHPHRLPNRLPSLDLLGLGSLTFEPPDLERFPCLRLAYDAALRGGTAPAALNAANEVAVQYFLDGKISFMDIPRVLDRVVAEHEYNPSPGLSEILTADRAARSLAGELCRESLTPKVN